jgi:integrase
LVLITYHHLPLITGSKLAVDHGRGRTKTSTTAPLGTVDPDSPIFPNSRGGYLNASNLNNRYWIPFRTRAGYEWVTFHTFRKTVATLLDDAGLSARQIADILGHAHPSMTQNTYMGRGQVSRDGAEALNNVVRPST